MDVELILEKLAEFGFVRLHKISGDYYQIYCPIHNDGKERRPSCGVLLRDQYKNGQMYPAGFTHCFSCSYANSLVGLITDILKTRNISKSGQDWLVENIPGFEPESDFEYLIPQSVFAAATNKFAIDNLRELAQPKMPYVSEAELASYRYTVPYMYERKLTDAIIEKYDVGYDGNWIPPGRKRPVPCITFPVRDREGHTLFFCRRSVQGKLYNYPDGVTKPVFGLDMIPEGCKSIVVCESIINALTAEVYGYDAVALMGTGNSYQIKQLRELGVNEFVLALDGDDAGRRGASKLKNALKDVGLVWTMSMPDGKDVNDLSQLEFDTLYRDKE